MTPVRASVAVALALVALAAPRAAAELNIAVLDSARAIQQSEEFKVFAEAVRRDLEPDRKELETLQEGITALETRLRDEGEVMSDSERRAVEKERDNKKFDLEVGGTKLQRAFQDRQEEELQQMGGQLQAILRDLVEVDRYDVVFERRNVLWVNPRHDITAKVTEKLNERFAEDRDGAGAAE